MLEAKTTYERAMVILQLVDGRPRDLGGFAVRRVLPFAARQMVGPFIFFDHLRPDSIGSGVRYRRTASSAYRAGHRDVFILRFARTSRQSGYGTRDSPRRCELDDRRPRHRAFRENPAARRAAETFMASKAGLRCPTVREDVEPSFTHYPASALPRHQLDGVELALIAGQAFGMHSPVDTLWPTLYAQAKFTQGSTLQMPAEYGERAVYVVEGDLTVGSQDRRGPTRRARAGKRIRLRADGEARAMLLGGERFPTPRYIWWNFVASSQERIELAKTALGTG